MPSMTMQKFKKSLRQQLLEARNVVQRQIEILSTGRNYRGGETQSDAVTKKLTATLRQIEDSLTDLGQSDE